eukprot:CAMPEP_0183308844 /NCGR_PEP_ID=MMETSP0160_2-20130417/22607_1 /TAXON_ID=2839 ORGANISM="Odontella Sinensis, Strain Grunow 1884" /NCGR_SAMPLE_ID=MMETSP0160_2 /ASSEMBLY_ACC=CAM_ASM_000250 /LENGTH=209 /DNA_ID=CAMNT_0025472749 /DNA_START=49 /DNA_END=675 /DNA_ORIENTATION=+
MACASSHAEPRRNRSDAGVTPTVFTGARILCYGDSLTAGFHPLRGFSVGFSPYSKALSEALGGIAVDHAGLRGWTTDQMVRYCDSERTEAFGQCYPGLRRLVVRGGYDVVILMAGTNDIGSLDRPEEVAGRLKELHQICHAAGARTVGVSVPQSFAASDLARTNGRICLRDQQQRVNDHLRQYALQSRGQCLYVHMESLVPWEPKNSDW